MNLRLLLGYAAPYRATLFLSGLLGLAEAAVALTIPWMGGRFAAMILSGAALPSVAILPLLLGLFAAQAVLKLISARVQGRVSTDILADLRVRIYDHLQALPLNFYHARRQGDVLTLVTHEAEQLAGFITGTLLSIGPLILLLAGAIVFMFRIDATLAAVVGLFVPVFYLVLKVFGRRLRFVALQTQQARASAVAIADENLGMLPAIKTFTREAEESARYARQVDELRVLGVKQIHLYALLDPAMQFVAASAVVLLLWLAGDRIGSGQMNPSELIGFLLYAALLTRPVSALAGVYGQTQMARGTLERMQDVFTERPEPLLSAGRPLPDAGGEIEFRDVTFAYPGRASTLAGLSLRVRAGETLAITGENGAGKSTIAHLLMRLHEPQSGAILIDGVDISLVGLQNLRRHIGIVPQHVLLFNGTVRDNIRYGRQNAGGAEVEVAARLAQAHEFITLLPDGYDTVIGDHGIRLSGGQRQRLALARALLKDPPILILDEATAMFDPRAEALFIEECEEALARRTVIIITHRPASLALADRVLKIESGAASISKPDLTQLNLVA